MSDNIRLVPAPLDIVFDVAQRDPEGFEREFQRLSETDDDPIGQWLKIAKARGETKETDPVLLHLIIELHRKVDQLTQIVKHEEPERIDLPYHAHIESIGFEHFKLKESMLEPGKRYYGRITMPLFPKRDMGIWFDAIDERMAKIVRLHDRDEKEWSSYVVARERVMIREMKGKKGE
ncbi:hypothetical protein [Hydrogenimonas cancrithermarum]|uniref:Uncharacterized protein n=1 Tax=Hydrogenimonas cancrithermarum TaxID=2993563 RepID=A0ABM8FNW4_9BACT|nr:hypothetical protein [Hydrogenimonas cancrithermarum]BDY13299.1 hypothetical protein HCR_16110 [Hydrogenimonas cancrithermarum]